MITAKQVKELRDLTGAGMLDCKKHLKRQMVTFKKLLFI